MSRDLNPDLDVPPHCWLCGSQTQLPKSILVPCSDCEDGGKLGIWLVIVPDDSKSAELLSIPPVFRPVGPMVCVHDEEVERLIRMTIKAEVAPVLWAAAKMRRFHFVPESVARSSGLLDAAMREVEHAAPGERVKGPGHPDNLAARRMPKPSEN
jgi:hypothetical protein